MLAVYSCSFFFSMTYTVTQVSLRTNRSVPFSDYRHGASGTDLEDNRNRIPEQSKQPEKIKPNQQCWRVNYPQFVGVHSIHAFTVYIYICMRCRHAVEAGLVPLFSCKLMEWFHTTVMYSHQLLLRL